MEELKNKVMVVDDDDTVIVPIRIMLKKKNIDCVSYTDPVEALTYLENGKVDVILVDYHMEPNINGDEFIKRLREFDKETIVYLHTAYSEELPAVEMMEKYNIQGYIDKGKGNDTRIQLLTSALKHSELLKLVKKQAEEIESLSYKNKFIGKFFSRLMGEIRENSFGMALNINLLKEIENEIQDKEDYNNCVQNISNSLHKINELVTAIDIEDRFITVEEFDTILRKLFKTKLCVKNVKLIVKTENDDNSIIQCSTKILLYMLVDIIDYLISIEEKEIRINIEKRDNVRTIKIYNIIKDNELIQNLKKLSLGDEKITLILEDEKIIIKINN